MRSLGIVDISSFAHRYFHSPGPDEYLDGVNVKGVRLFDKLLKSFQSSKPVTHLVAAADSDMSSRKVMFPEYKSSRDAPSDEFVRQMFAVRRLFRFCEVPVLSLDGWEADDVIASLVHKIGGRMFVRIYSEDKDCRAMLGRAVVIQRKDSEVTDVSMFHDEGWKIRPDQVVDFLSLVGSSGSDLPGVSGIGKKTAQSLLSKYGSIDGVFAALSAGSSGLTNEGDPFILPGLTGAQQKNLLSESQRLFAVRSVISLRTNLVLPDVGSASEISLVDSSGYWKTKMYLEHEDG